MDTNKHPDKQSIYLYCLTQKFWDIESITKLQNYNSIFRYNNIKPNEKLSRLHYINDFDVSEGLGCTVDSIIWGRLDKVSSPGLYKDCKADDPSS